MPGGDRETIERMLPILQKIAARDFAGNACVTYVGSAAAGNFVKMVHNGIEYAIMQGIAEIYDILR
jgi:6-phosphogluconate dehydrogenase